MRRTTAAVMAVMLSLLAGCGEKKQPESAPETGNASVTGNVQESAAIPAEETSAAEEKTESASSARDEATQPEKEPEEAAVSGEDSAVSDTLSDQELLEIAENLYQAACETEWNFTVGSPFELDTANYVENSIGWQFYLVTESGINSMDDVYREYHKVFAEDYDDHLSELFLEENGRVYCLNGARGSDIFYSRSEIVSIAEKTGDRAAMTVTDYYDGTDFNEKPYSLDRELVIEKTADGWRVAEFTLPY